MFLFLAMTRISPELAATIGNQQILFFLKIAPYNALSHQDVQSIPEDFLPVHIYILMQ